MRAPRETFERAKRLRRDMTLPEVVLWTALRGGRLRGLRFRRQHPLGPYILDFFCAAARLGVEVDGAGHDLPEQIAHDRRRDAYLGSVGVEVIRFAAEDVLRDELLDGVLRRIGDVAERRIAGIVG